MVYQGDILLPLLSPPPLSPPLSPLLSAPLSPPLLPPEYLPNLYIVFTSNRLCYNEMCPDRISGVAEYIVNECSVHCTVYCNVHRIPYCVQIYIFRTNYVQRTMYTIPHLFYISEHTLKNTLYTSLYTVQCTLYSVQ